MKRLAIWRIGVILAILCLLGCVTGAKQGLAPTTSNSAYPTAVTSTPTPQPGILLAPTTTPGAFLTQIPVPTLTLAPTLNPSERQALFQEMLKASDDCDLPCWWGVTPGETPWDTMYGYFLSHGIDARDGHLNPGWGYLPEWGYFTVDFEKQGDLVGSIDIRSCRLHDSYPEDLWRRFELPRLLDRYGVPSQVHLNWHWGEFPPHYYDMWIEYTGLGIAVRYSGLAVDDALGYYVCPVFERLQEIEIFLQAPGATIEAITRGTTELTGMTLQEFHSTFSRSTGEACVYAHSPSYVEAANAEVRNLHNPRALTHRQEDMLLVDLLDSNKGCELPCWWGITPGLTDWEDAKQVFVSYGRGILSYENRLSVRSEMSIHEISLFGRHEPLPFDYVIRHSIHEQNDQIVLIEVSGETLSWVEPQYFVQDWHRYHLHKVMSRFGQPAQVLLHYLPYPPEVSYDIGVVYDDLGFMIEYSGITRVDADEGVWRLETTPICPQPQQLRSIRLWLAPPDEPISWEQVFCTRRGKCPSLQEATGMDVQAFYETYVHADTQDCFEVPEKYGDSVP